MDRKKYIKGFLLGVLCTALMGGGVLGYLWQQDQKGVLNASTVKKAKVDVYKRQGRICLKHRKRDNPDLPAVRLLFPVQPLRLSERFPSGWACF